MTQNYAIKDANGQILTVQTTPVGPTPAAEAIAVTPAVDAIAEPGGKPITDAAMPSGGVGLTGWMSANWKALTGKLSVSADALPLPTGAATDANLSTAVGSAGQSAPALSTGASGLTGWLRKIVDVLQGDLSVSISNLPTSTGSGTAVRPLTFIKAASSPATLTSSWTKVCTITAGSLGLRIAPLASATIFDIEWTFVAAGAATPSDAAGEPIFGGEDFAAGLPIGDIYLRSASGQTALIKTA